MKSKAHCIACCVMIWGCLAIWCHVPLDQACARGSSVSDERRQTEAQLNTFFDVLERSAKEIPRDTFDPQAILNTVGTDPAMLFRWVRDNTSLVPYRGSVRGHIGVLMDRLGNSLDRAILLHRLLSMAGHKVRLVRGHLTRKAAEAVLKTTRSLQEVRPSAEMQALDFKKMPHEYPDAYGLCPTDLEKMVQTMRAEQQHRYEELSQLVEEQAELLIDLLAPLTEGCTAARNAAIHALQDHWWLEWQGSSGWIALDPSLPEALPGERLTDMQAVVQSPQDLEPKDLHRLTIRVQVERSNAGRLEVETVLEHTMQPSQLFGKRVRLCHIPLNWPEDLTMSKPEKLRENFKAAVLKQDEWLPVLSVGADSIWQSSFTAAGTVNASPGKEPASEMGDGLREGFGMLVPMSKEPQTKPCLTAVRIVFDMPSPQGRGSTQRTLFDIKTFEDVENDGSLQEALSQEQIIQRNMAFFEVIEGMIPVCRISDNYLKSLLYNAVLDNRKEITALFDFFFSSNPAVFLNTDAHMDIPPLPLFAFGAERMPTSIYIDEPNIICHHRGMTFDFHTDLPIVYSGLDIIKNDVAALGKDTAHPIQTVIRSGVWDSFLESYLLSPIGKYGPLESICRQMMAHDSQWRKVSTADDPLLNALNPLARSIIQDELARGSIIIVPETDNLEDHPAKSLWWRIDPETGATLIMGHKGWGQAYSEYVKTIDAAMSILGYLSYFGGLIGCLDEATATEAIQPLDETESEKDSAFYQCLQSVVCNQLMSELGSIFDFQPKTFFELGQKKLYNDLLGGLCSFLK